MRFYALPALVWLVCAGCSSEENVVDEVGVRIVRFPGGESVRAEVMQTPGDMARGMMYRDSLAPDRGMLFVHQKPGHYPYWMYRVKIPLDIIFMDANQNIVHIARDTPPCQAEAREAKDCPHYAPDPPRPVQYVLELAGGQAKRYGLQPGDQLRF
jgi:uncharacterized membrane protein (UPF0127 family)